MVHTALGANPFSLICDGDDFVILCERANAANYAAVLQQCYTKYGHELEFDVITSVPEEIDYCQKKPVALKTGWRMVRNPKKVLCTTTHSTRNYDNPASIKTLFRSVGLGDSYCNNGVPVLQSFARMIYRIGTGSELLSYTASDISELYRTLHPSDPLFQRLATERNLAIDTEITHEARISFAIAYGILPAQQLHMESFFNSVQDYEFEHPQVSDHWIADRY